MLHRCPDSPGSSSEPESRHLQYAARLLEQPQQLTLPHACSPLRVSALHDCTTGPVSGLSITATSFNLRVDQALVDLEGRHRFHTSQQSASMCSTPPLIHKQRREVVVNQVDGSTPQLW